MAILQISQNPGHLENLENGVTACLTKLEHSEDKMGACHIMWGY